MADYTVSDTIYMMFTTRAFATGIPTVLAGTPVVSAYEDNSVTQITAGITLGVSHDSVVGLNLLTIVATGANGFEAGKQYNMVITTGTVGGVSVVGEVVGTFSLEAEAAFTRLGAPAGASVSADIAAIEAQTDDIGAAGAGLSAVPWNAAWDTEVQSEVNDALVAFWTSPATLVDLVWDEVLSGASHNVASSAGRRLRAIQDAGIYESGAIWIDTVNGTAGTTDFENGTANLPVDSWADALTLSASVGLTKFNLLPGSSITLTGASDAYEFSGQGYTVALAGQSISGTIFTNATITGNDDGTNTLAAIYNNCIMATSTLALHKMYECQFTANITLAEAGDYIWDRCSSFVAGSGTPDVTFPAGNAALSVRHYSGGMQINSMAAGDTMSYEADGQFKIAASCTGGAVSIRGCVGPITDGAGGAVTLTENARIADDTINAEVDTALSDIGLQYVVNTALPTNWSTDITANSALDYMADDGTATFDRTTDSLQAIADSGGGGPTAAQIADAVWDEPTAGHTTGGTFGEQVKTDIDAILVDTTEIGVAGAGLTNIDLPDQTMNITGNLSGSVGSVTGSVGSVTGAVGSVTGNVGGNVVGSVASVTASVTIDGTSVDLIWDETLTAHVTADSAGVALKDILADTNELQSDDVPGLIAALNDISTAQVNTEVDTALSDIGLQYLVNTALPTSWTTDITANSALDYMADDGTATYDRTTDSLQAISDSGGGGPTAGQIADAVWDELTSGHTTAGTFGEQCKTDIDAILADTNELQTDDVPGLIAALNDIAATDIVSSGAITTLAGAVVNVDLVDTCTTNTDMVAEAPAASSVADAVWDEALSGHVGAGSFGKAVADIETDATAILADTADMQPKLGTPAADISADIAAVKVDTAAILVDTGTTLDTKLNDIQGAGFVTGTDSLEAIRDRGDAAWTTGAGGSDRLLMVDTTIATLATQTSFTLTAGSADNDAYNNCTIIVEDVATSTQKAVGMVLDYVGSTKTVTLKEALAFTIATTDKVYILAENSLKSTVANRQLDVTATGAAGIDWGNVENPTTAVDLSATDIQLADTVTTLTGHTAQTGDTYALANGASGFVAIDTVVDGIQSDLDNGTDGLGAIKTAVDAIPTSNPSAASIADAVWDETTVGHTTAGTFGEQCKTDIDAILADTNELQGDDVPGLIAALNDVSTAQVNTEVDTALADFFTSSAQLVDDIWDETLTSHVTADSAGVAVKDILADTNELQGDDVPGLIGALNDISTAQVNTEVDTALSDIGLQYVVNTALPTNWATDITANSALDYMADDGTAVYDRTTDSLQAIADSGGGGPTAGQIADAVWDEPTAGHTTGGTFGEQCKTDIDAILADTNELQGDDVPGLIAALNDIAATDIVSAGAITTLAGAVVNVDLVDTTTTNTDMVAAAPTAAAVADQVWDEAIAGHLGAGSTGEALNGATAPSAATVADAVWDEALSGHVVAGSAGKALADVESDVTDILADTADMQPKLGSPAGASISADIATVDGNVDSILVDTGTTIPAQISSLNDLSSGDVTAAVPTAIENADALLNRDMSAVSDTTARSPLNALRFLRNKWSITGTTLTVTEEDDTTAAWTATVTGDATADPVIGSDPA